MPIGKKGVHGGRMMPICIAGMHRSGTSLIARLLNLSGLYLGEPDELIAPKPDNPRGFWENIAFTVVNKSIGSSELGLRSVLLTEIPSLPERWWMRPQLQALRVVGRYLVDAMNSRSGLWGWKDPRNSLYLPFWQELIPNLKVVICLRHPAACAQSLHARSPKVSVDEGIKVWYVYNRLLVDTVPKENRIVVSYDHFFVCPLGNLNDLCVRTGLWPGVTLERMDRILEEVDPQLMHHAPVGDLPPETKLLYHELLEEAK